MNIFILEDNKDRIDYFKTKLEKEHTLTICDNVKDAKKYLTENEYDALFLDHDLDDRIYVNSNEENTGYQLVKHICTKDLQCSATIYIHSLNPSGSHLMFSTLKKDGYKVLQIPFHKLLDMFR